MSHFPLIIDIGARWSYKLSTIKQINKNFIYIGFEPDSIECNRLNKKFSKYKNIKFFQHAIGKVNKNKNKFYITKVPECSSLKKPIEYFIQNFNELNVVKLKKEIIISTITLKKFLSDYFFDTIAYLKLDTQGTELDILKGSGDLIKNTLIIESEFQLNNLYHNSNLFSAADIYLRNMGFTLWNIRSLAHHRINGLNHSYDCNFNFNFDNRNYLINKFDDSQVFWGDFIFINTRLFNNKQFFLKHLNDINNLESIYNISGIKNFLHQNAKVKKWI